MEFLDVEVCVHVLGPFQNAELHLHLGDAEAAVHIAGNLFEPFEGTLLQILAGRNPAVPLADDADEEGDGVIDLPETDFHDLPALAFLGRDAPAKVEFGERHIPF